MSHSRASTSPFVAPRASCSPSRVTAPAALQTLPRLTMSASRVAGCPRTGPPGSGRGGTAPVLRPPPGHPRGCNLGHGRGRPDHREHLCSRTGPGWWGGGTTLSPRPVHDLHQAGHQGDAGSSGAGSPATLAWVRSARPCVRLEDAPVAASMAARSSVMNSGFPPAPAMTRCAPASSRPARTRVEDGRLVEPVDDEPGGPGPVTHPRRVAAGPSVDSADAPAEETQRHEGRAAADRADGPQARRVDPFARSPTATSSGGADVRILSEATNTYHPELQSGITRHGDGAPAVVAGGRRRWWRASGGSHGGRGSGDVGLQSRAWEIAPNGQGALQLFALARRDREAAGAGIGERLGQQPGLPDTGLTLDEDDCRPTGRQRVQRSGAVQLTAHAPAASLQGWRRPRTRSYPDQQRGGCLAAVAVTSWAARMPIGRNPHDTHDRPGGRAR